MLSEVEAKHKEVIKDAQTAISCVITGLRGTDAATIEWHSDDANTKVTGTDLEPTPGSNVQGDQTTTLLAKTGAVTADKVYYCQVKSGTYTDSEASKTAVNLDVYG